MGNRKLTYADLEKRVLQLEKEIALEKEIKLKFKTVFENSVEGIILIDENGTVTDWNRFIAARTGLNWSLRTAASQLRSGARASLRRRACCSVIKLPKAAWYRGCSTPEKMYCRR